MDNEEEGQEKIVMNFDFASLYPTMMKDNNDELRKNELIRRNRDEVVNDLLGNEDEIEPSESIYLRMLRNLYKERFENKKRKNG